MMRSAVLRLPSLITQLMNLRHERAADRSDRAGMSRFGISRLSWHGLTSPSYDFGRFAPYFERPCMRPCTPTASSVPRTT